MDNVSEKLMKWIDAQDVEFVDATAEKNYKARAQRISDVISLKKTRSGPRDPQLWYVSGSGQWPDRPGRDESIR